MTVHFRQFVPVLHQAVLSARTSIQIAVCWFTHRGLFNALLQKCREGISVTVMLEYDSQNFKPGGIDWAVFLKAGGRLHGNTRPELMHHKFAIIDGSHLLAGSFNWTYNQNSEHLLSSTDSALVAAFHEEWIRLISQVPSVTKIDWAQVKRTAYFPLFQDAVVTKARLRQMIVGGAKVWVIKSGKKRLNGGQDFFIKQRLFVEDGSLTRAYWDNHQIWRPDWFREWLSEQNGHFPTNRLAHLKRWLLRMKLGDLAVLLNQHKDVSGLGVVQSIPRFSFDAAGTVYREIQWVLSDIQEFSWPYARLPLGGCSVYRGSGLALLEQLFSHKASREANNKTLPYEQEQ